ncbi:membrane protein insertase YidC [Actinoplanes couchii]|uniref:Membrane protein insertase YidC n=1 Tax=Actinoplanes couchii TaxID=403638 RepID=A0ABQ3X1J8_9ACTN|nr:membrane protein insertase YidC [Actinoplanes couchii]MDR6316789.1 YidC/Oxa1 family membrane protein insertase [Actinoplanes couchii]GID52396.1 membrane protein insertase YidC [Actinoplanes couchii]
MFSDLMSLVYHGISALLLFWHGLWDRVLGDPHGLGTDWAWVLGIVFLVLTVRAAIFPLFLRQVRSQQAMQRLQPQLRELQAKHKGDIMAMQAEQSALFRREKVSPFGAFLPMLLQLPIFIGLLHVLRHLKPSITNGRTLYGWTETQFADASFAKFLTAPIAAGFHSSSAELATLGADGTTVKLVVGVLIAAMVITTYLTSRMSILKTGWSDNPQQRTIQRLMLYGIPASLLFSGLIFPLGVIIYWTTTNLVTLAQQWWIHRRYPSPEPTPLATTTATPESRPSAAPIPTTTPKPGAKPAQSRRRPTAAAGTHSPAGHTPANGKRGADVAARKAADRRRAADLAARGTAGK